MIHLFPLDLMLPFAIIAEFESSGGFFSRKRRISRTRLDFIVLKCYI